MHIFIVIKSMINIKNMAINFCFAHAKMTISFPFTSRHQNVQPSFLKLRLSSKWEECRPKIPLPQLQEFSMNVNEF